MPSKGNTECNERFLKVVESNRSSCKSNSVHFSLRQKIRIISYICLLVYVQINVCIFIKGGPAFLSMNAHADGLYFFFFYFKRQGSFVFEHTEGKLCAYFCMDGSKYQNDCGRLL